MDPIADRHLESSLLLAPLFLFAGKGRTMRASTREEKYLTLVMVKEVSCGSTGESILGKTTTGKW